MRSSVARYPPQPVRPLAHIIVGSAIEAAYFLSRTGATRRAKEEIGAVVDRLITSFCLH
ncbi:hypothetical protein [Mycobacteroides salmoniphilum]|uniref:hypothetical protein n=1 Tax=Mycobacteroides salmoniphilum TaxID=404941 RepID=UPI0039887777